MSCVALFLGMCCDLLSGHMKIQPPFLVFPHWKSGKLVNKILSFLLESAQGEAIRSLEVFSGHVFYLGLCVSFLKTSLWLWLCLNILIYQRVSLQLLFGGIDVLLYSSVCNLLPPGICESKVPHTTIPATAFHSFCHLRSKLCHNFLSELWVRWDRNQSLWGSP